MVASWNSVCAKRLKGSITQLLAKGWIRRVDASLSRYKITRLGDSAIQQAYIAEEDAIRQSLQKASRIRSLVFDCFDAVGYVEANQCYLPEKLQNKWDYLRIESQRLNQVDAYVVLLSIRHADDDTHQCDVTWLVHLADSGPEFVSEVDGCFEHYSHQVATTNFVIVYDRPWVCRIHIVCRNTLSATCVEFADKVSHEEWWCTNTAYQPQDTFTYICHAPDTQYVEYRANIADLVLRGSSAIHIIAPNFDRVDFFRRLLGVNATRIEDITLGFRDCSCGMGLRIAIDKYDPWMYPIAQTDDVIVSRTQVRRSEDPEERKRDQNDNPWGWPTVSEWIIVIDKKSGNIVKRWNANDLEICGDVIHSISAAFGPVSIYSL